MMESIEGVQTVIMNCPLEDMSQSNKNGSFRENIKIDSDVVMEELVKQFDTNNCTDVISKEEVLNTKVKELVITGATNEVFESLEEDKEDLVVSTINNLSHSSNKVDAETPLENQSEQRVEAEELVKDKVFKDISLIHQNKKEITVNYKLANRRFIEEESNEFENTNMDQMDKCNELKSNYVDQNLSQLDEECNNMSTENKLDDLLFEYEVMYHMREPLGLQKEDNFKVISGYDNCNNVEGTEIKSAPELEIKEDGWSESIQHLEDQGSTIQLELFSEHHFTRDSSEENCDNDCGSGTPSLFPQQMFLNKEICQVKEVYLEDTAGKGRGNKSTTFYAVDDNPTNVECKENVNHNSFDFENLFGSLLDERTKPFVEALDSNGPNKAYTGIDNVMEKIKTENLEIELSERKYENHLLKNLPENQIPIDIKIDMLVRDNYISSKFQQSNIGRNEVNSDNTKLQDNQIFVEFEFDKANTNSEILKQPTEELNIQEDDNKTNKNILETEIPLADKIPARRKTSIFLKKDEMEGRSRSPSPIPKRYRKRSHYHQTTQAELKFQHNEESDKIYKPPVLNYSTSNVFEKKDTVLSDYENKNANAHGDNSTTDPSQDFHTHLASNINGILTKFKIITEGIKNRTLSGGSTSEDDISPCHKTKSKEINIKGRKCKYDSILMLNNGPESCDEDELGNKHQNKSVMKVNELFENKNTNRVLLEFYGNEKHKSFLGSPFKSCFGLDRKKTSNVEMGNDKGRSLERCSSEPNRLKLDSQSSRVLKLTEKDLTNRELIENLLQPMKIPLLRQRTLSSGDEYEPPLGKPCVNTVKSRRTRSHGCTDAVVVRKSNSNVEPWKGAWDNTFLKIVEPNDTLSSVAAHFDITPSELAILNRLPSNRTVFPGQVIRVPDKRRRDAKDTEDKENQQANPEATAEVPADDKSEVCDDEMDMLEKLRLTSPKPGHAERVRTPLSPTPDPSHQRFLKINVRHITDGQGVVGGVLLVTSNAVMFDPNVSDPLVIEHGPESYGVIAPMEYVVNVAIYHDIAHMRVGSHDQFRPDWPKPEVYYLKDPEETEGEGSSGTLLTTNQGDSLDSGDPHHSPSAREDSLLAKDETFLELRSSTEDEEEENGSLCSVPREGDAFPKAFDRELVTPTNLTTPGDKQDSEHEGPTSKLEGVALVRSLEERRKSSLDHHWAVPSKVRSLEEQSASAPDSREIDNNRRNSEGLLVKLSCHDSGIDIRDPPPVVPQIPRKSVYSDADVLLSDDFVPPVPIQPLRTGDDADTRRKKTSSVSFSLEEGEEVVPLREKDDAEKETKKNKMLKRLSYPLSWMEGLSGDKDEKESSLPSSAESPHPSSHSSSVFSKVFSRRSSVGTFIRQQHNPNPPKDKSTAPKLDYRSMVSVEDMPELFVSFDKLIPRPAQSCEDPPLYLRLRMGKPKNRKIPKSTPIMSYGKKKMRPEYWFSVPRERVDDLYRFLMVWVPHLYGDLNEVTVADRGYELVDSDTELWETEEGTKQDGRRGSDDDLGDLTRESWEVLSMSEELRRALYASSAASLDLELCLPDLNGVTEILSEDHRKQLCRHLPARAEGYVWTLVFSTSQHGFSLNSMYRKMTRVESPILLVIQDTENNVFGALTSCALKMSDHFYGTGESLLFRFAPDIQDYKWTGDNMYFIKGNNESLSIGAGDGKFGLWLDGDLYQGRTEPCNTYGNDPLTPSQDFVVKTLECWAFI